MFESRDRSVVKSSVMPSAKYCCLGSSLRLVNGSTAIDRRGATRGRGLGVAAATAVADRVEAVLIAGQPHRAPTAMTSPTEATPATTAIAPLRRRGEAIGARDAGRSAA